MRSAVALALWVPLFAVTANAWPWPWHRPNKTAPPAQSAVSAFETGVASALGFKDVSSCYKGTKTGVEDLWDAAEDYRRGGYVSKAKALAKFGEGIHQVVDALEPCSDGMTDESKYKQLLKYMKDPRYYTVHNALTLSLNLAEDRSQLGGFATAWQKGNFAAAGSEVVSVALDVLLHPGIPEGNGTVGEQIAYGIAEGFTTDIDLPCFKDVRVEIPALVGGMIDVASVVDMVGGIESLFHGIEGVVPTFKHCLGDRSRIMSLLHDFGDFEHPASLAGQVIKNLKTYGVDLSLDAASAVLAYKGEEWQRFGLSLGKMLGRMTLPTAEKTASVVV